MSGLPRSARSLLSRHVPRRVLAIGVLVVLALSPLWYASAVPLAWAGNGLAFGLLALGLAAVRLATPSPGSALVSRLGWPGSLYGAVVIWTLVQASGATPTSWHHPIWASAAQALGTPLAGAISIDPSSTLLGTLRLLTFGLLFWTVFACADSDPRFATATVWTVCAAATVDTAYGLLDVLSETNHVLFAPKDVYVIANQGPYVSGTFIDRSHYAAYAGLGLVCATGLLLSQARRTAPEAAGLSWRRSIAGVARRGAPALLAGAILLAGLVLSQSRGGIATAVVGVLAVLALYAMRGRRAGAAVLGGALAAVLLALLSIAGGALIRRTQMQADPFGGRLPVVAATLRALRDLPWQGSGYGTFADLFPLYRDAAVGIGGTWNAAHNSWIEVAATLGLPAAGALVLALVLVVAACLRGALRRRRDGLAPVVASATALQLALHSIVDFPLQTEAVALAFAALLGAGAARSSSPEDARPGPPGGPRA